MKNGFQDIPLLKPDFFTFVPKNFEANEAEFFDSVYFEPVMSEYPSESEINVFRREVHNALHSTLSMVEQHQLKEKIVNNPGIVKFLEINRGDLAAFIDLNPMVASEIIFYMMKNCNIKEYTIFLNI